MTEFYHQHETHFWYLAVLSAVTFVGSLIAVPWLVARIPADYFTPERRQPAPWRDRHPAVRLALLLLKNLFGVVFVLAGVVMLFLPGQGLITIVVGILLLDFPGKFRFERWLVRHPAILRPINWIRRRAGRESLTVEEIPKRSKPRRAS
jgi:hypothetical protein